MEIHIPLCFKFYDMYVFKLEYYNVWNDLETYKYSNYTK